MPNPPYGVLVYSDNFARPDGPLVAPWIPVTNYYSGSGVHQLPTLKSNGWTVLTGTSGIANSFGVYDAALPNDQWAQATFTAVGAMTTDTELGVGVRMSLDGQNGYFILAGPNAALTQYCLEFWKVVAGTYTQLGGGTYGTANLPGDSFGVEAIGSNIIFRYNGAVVFACVDTDLTSGFSGIFAGTAEGSASTQATIASTWQAGNVNLLGTTQLAVDTFWRIDENPLSDGGNWTANITSGTIVPAQLVSDTAQSTATTYQANAVWTGLTWPNDQYAEITLSALVDVNSFAYADVRASVSDDTRYRIAVQGPFGSSAVFYLAKRVAGSQTILGTLNGAVSANDTIRLAIQGSTITVYQNGVLLSALTTTDSSIASGSAGFGLQVAATLVDAAVSLWIAGTLSPVPTSINPTSGVQGATIATFTINGSNFGTAGTISFSGTGITVNSYSVQTDTQIVASITISAGAATTARDVTVTNPTNASTIGTLAASFTVTASHYSVPDCRDYGNFPNLPVDVNGTETYIIPSVDSRAAGAPVDSRVSIPVASGTYPQNSRTPGTFGPGE